MGIGRGVGVGIGFPVGPVFPVELVAPVVPVWPVTPSLDPLGPDGAVAPPVLAATATAGTVARHAVSASILIVDRTRTSGQG
jgi:hypothetical protein